MKTMSVSSLILFVVLLMGCNNNDPVQPTQQDLELNFKALYGDDPLVLFQEYDYQAGTKTLFQLYQFYLSDIRLIRADGSAEAISDIELVSFEQTTTPASAEAGVTVALEDIPAGDYVKIQMGIGVDPELNKTTPSEYEPGHPLSDNYWSAAKGYIHSKIEGRSDTLSGDGFDNGITFHTGSDALYTIVEFDIQLTIDERQPAPLQFTSDLRSVLIQENGEFIDFRQYSVDHHSKAEVFEFIGRNLPLSFETIK